MAARHKKGNFVAPKAAAVPATQFPGKAVEQEAKAKSHGFKKGGKVDGCPPGMRMDKAPRKASGGAVAGSMRGRSPMSSAKNVSPASNGGKSNGYY